MSSFCFNAIPSLLARQIMHVYENEGVDKLFLLMLNYGSKWDGTSHKNQFKLKTGFSFSSRYSTQGKQT